MSYNNPPGPNPSIALGLVEPPRRGGRPPDLTRNVRILEAAWTLFLGSGVEATSMEAVAAEAHVSKSTLYAAYPDRAALFEAAMLHAMLRIEADQKLEVGKEEATALRQRLVVFGVGIMSFLASEVGVAFYGVLSSEIRRRPDLSEAFWRLGPGRTRANLTEMLSNAAARGELNIAEPGQAADLLFGMWQGYSNLELAVTGGAEKVRAGIDERVQRGTDAFLRLHAG